jgi:hypothetical protein
MYTPSVHVFDTACDYMVPLALGTPRHQRYIPSLRSTNDEVIIAMTSRCMCFDDSARTQDCSYRVSAFYVHVGVLADIYTNHDSVSAQKLKWQRIKRCALMCW